MKDRAFPSLRALLAERPSSRLWRQLRGLLLRWPTEETRALAFSYAEDHLASWPDHLRAASLSDFQPDIFGAGMEGFWRLCRSLTLSQTGLTEVERLGLLGAPALQGIRELALFRAFVGEEEDFVGLPSLPMPLKLHTLRLHGFRLYNGDLRNLPDAFHALHALDLRGCWMSRKAWADLWLLNGELPYLRRLAVPFARQDLRRLFSEGHGYLGEQLEELGLHFEEEQLLRRGGFGGLTGYLRSIKDPPSTLSISCAFGTLMPLLYDLEESTLPNLRKVLFPHLAQQEREAVYRHWKGSAYLQTLSVQCNGVFFDEEDPLRESALRPTWPNAQETFRDPLLHPVTPEDLEAWEEETPAADKDREEVHPVEASLETRGWSGKIERFFLHRGAQAQIIGRVPDVQITLGEQTVSRRHAQIVPSDGGFVLQDLRSVAGTFCNGEKVEEQRLRDKDAVRVGRVGLRFRQNEAVASQFYKSLFMRLTTEPTVEIYGSALFREFLEDAFWICQKEERTLALLQFGVDGQGSRNERFGPLVGDIALIHVARVLQEALGMTPELPMPQIGQPLLGRSSGDTFSLLLFDVSSAQALECAEQLRTAVVNTPLSAQPAQQVTVSAGVAMLEASTPDRRTASSMALLTHADRCLIEAKRRGRNTSVHLPYHTTRD